MQKQVLNYRIIIEPERQGKKTVYNAACPTLGVYDYGDSVEEALESIKDGIELALECMAKDGQEIPLDSPQGLVVTAQVKAPARAKLSFA